MLGQHTTKEKQNMLIAEMETSHINNFIHLALKSVSSETEIDNKTAILYGLKQKTKESNYAKQKIVIENLYPYFAELLFRGELLELRSKDMLQNIMSRDGRLIIPGRTLRLPVPIIEDAKIVEWDDNDDDIF